MRGRLAAAVALVLVGGSLAVGQVPDTRPLTLAEALALAGTESPDLAAARADLDRAGAERLAAWGAFLPSIELGTGYVTSSTGRLDPTGQTFSTTSYTTELTGTYQLFDGFRKFAGTTRAGRRIDAARAGMRDRSFRTALDVKTAFFGGVAETERVAIEAERVARLEAGLEIVGIQLARGRASRSDSLRVEVELAAARLEWLRAKDAARAARFALGRAIGLDVPVDPVDPGPEPDPAPVDRAAALERALAAGPSLTRARAERRAAEAGLGTARGRYLPSVAVTGGWSWQSEEFPPEDGSWRVLVFASFPLFDGFAREGALLAARADAAAARAAERTAELEIRAEVDAAINQVEIARQALDLAETAAGLARAELAMSQERLRLGRESSLEHRDAEDAWRRAELDVVRARFDQRVGAARLDYLLGEEAP